MGKYLKKFETQAAYEAAKPNLILPNVSLIEENNGVAYNPYIPPETRVVAKFNVTDTSNTTLIGYKQYTSGFSEIEIDGAVQPNVISAYTFSTTGEHTIKYTLTNPTSIGNNALRECTRLTSVTIPNSVTSIGTSAFANCSSLTSIDIPSGVTSIGVDTFDSCSSLTSIDIPDGVTSIGDSTFGWCYGLTSIDMPDSVTSIGGYAFCDCVRLTSIDIPSGVTSIGMNAFSNCRNLTSVTVNAVTPPTLGFTAFYDTNDCPIYVPSASVNTYKSASGLSDYASRIQAIS